MSKRSAKILDLAGRTTTGGLVCARATEHPRAGFLGIRQKLRRSFHGAFDDCHFLLLVQGKGQMEGDGLDPTELRPGHWFFRPENWKHRVERSPDWVEFALWLPRGFTAFSPEPKRPPEIHLLASALPDTVRELEEFLGALGSCQGNWAAYRLLFALLERLDALSEPGHDTAWARLLEALGASRGAEKSVRAVAEAGGMNYHRFRRVFRERMGCSPNAWRIRRRMQEAARRLEQAEPPSIAELAHDLGFPDPYSFSKQFRREHGRPPSEWMRG